MKKNNLFIAMISFTMLFSCGITSEDKINNPISTDTKDITNNSLTSSQSIVSLKSNFDETVELKEMNHLTFQLAKSYTITLRIEEEKYTNNILDKLTYQNSDDIKITKVVKSSYFKTIGIEFICKQKINEGIFTIIFDGLATIINYNTEDFSFDQLNNFHKLSSLDDLSDFIEFKEVIESISYFEFDEENKANFENVLNSYNYSFRPDEEGLYQYDLSFLDHFSNSIYYPKKFSMVNDNLIASRDVGINYNKVNGETVIDSYSINYGVIDPCCTNPQNKLWNMSFEAKRKNEDNPYSSYNSTLYKYYLIFQEYPNEFYQYQLGDINVSIFTIGNYMSGAFFVDQNYTYTITSRNIEI